MPLDISDAESSFAKGRVEWEKFITNFERKWYAPYGMMQLGALAREANSERLKGMMKPNTSNFFRDLEEQVTYD